MILAVVVGPILVGVGILLFWPDTEYRFEVDTALREAVSAELTICDTKMPLSQSGTTFVATHVTNCEGGAEIQVLFHDQSSVSCMAGYVSWGLGRDFRFRISEDRCELVSETYNSSRASRPPA